jgi:hypothetical protein
MLIQHRRHIIKAGKPTQSEQSNFQTGITRELLNLVQQMADFGLAVNSLPGNFLWGGKLKPRHTGFLGIVSTLITIVKLLQLVP